MLVAVLVVMFVGLTSFVINSKMDSQWTSSTTETLVCSRTNEVLTLRRNGYVTCVNNNTNESLAGDYDIIGDRITVTWQNGVETKGMVESVYDVNSRKRIRMVDIFGNTFTNTERFVVRRR